MSNTKTVQKKNTAGTRKKTSGSTAARRSTAGKKTPAPRSAAVRTRKAMALELQEEEERKRFFRMEAGFILVCFLALFLFLSNFGLLGKVGAFAGGVQKGLLGYGAYVFPVFLVLLVSFCLKERKNTIFWIKIAADAILTLCVCTMLHLALGAETSHSFAQYYEAGKKGELLGMAAGGGLGGFTGDALINSLARVGAWLLIIALFLLCLVVITEKSLISFARRSAAKASRKAKEGGAYAHERFEEEKARLAVARENANLRRKEERMEKSLREQEAGIPSPGSSLFDLKAERNRAFTGFGNELTGTPGTLRRSESEPAAAENPEEEREVCLHPQPETEAQKHPSFSSRETEPEAVGKENTIEPEAIDYDSDTVPFEETVTERYRSFGRMLSGGKIDVRAAQQLGYAVSRENTTTNAAISSLQPEASAALTRLRAFETEEENVPGTKEESVPEAKEENVPLTKAGNFHETLAEKAMGMGSMEIQNAEAGSADFPEQKKALIEELPSEYDYPEDSVVIREETFELPPVSTVPVSPVPTSDIQPDYDELFHITDDDRARVYDDREKAAKEDTAWTPFSRESYPIDGKPLLKKETPDFEQLPSEEEPACQSGEAEKKQAPKEQDPDMEPRSVKRRNYLFPPVSLLKKGNKAVAGNQAETEENARKLERVLSEFGVGVTVTNVVKGPRVTRYEMTPDVGVKVSRITSLSGDIKLAMAASELRIEAPIPGKSAVGIEVPNNESATVTFRDIMETETFTNAKSRLTWGVGLDIQGAPVVGDIAKMPHLLVSGTTGSGKSVGINSIIMSVIYRSKPEDVRMILVDPKVVELSVYDGIPHLLAPVVTKPEQALAVLNKACAEMAHRYNLFKESNTRNIIGYNEKVEEINRTLPEDAEKAEKLPYILIIIDELSELMMHSKKDVESAIVSLTQLARAAGIHLVVATQRPSVDVVTGLIKSNIPSRVAYKLPSGTDSRTILDTYGAENLLGNGDMLYKPGNLNNPLRVQGAYLSDGEVEEVVEWLKKHNSASYDGEWENLKTKTAASEENESNEESGEDGRDEYFYEAGVLITEKKKASIGLLQRKFKIGFNRASRIMEQLNEAGVVSEGEGTKERQILMTTEEFQERF